MEDPAEHDADRSRSAHAALPAAPPADAPATREAEADAAMARYAHGDDAAFEAVHDVLAPRLYGFLRRHVRRAGQAEDLLQQTFLHVHRARGRFVPGAQVLPWAFAIARRLMIDACRRDRRTPQVELDAPGLAEPVASDATQDDCLAAGELDERMWRVYVLLPASQRAAFELIKKDGLTFRQAAAVLGVTVPAVKLRAQRAYDALRAAVASGRSASPTERGANP